jgi:hypothetical protein
MINYAQTFLKLVIPVYHIERSLSPRSEKTREKTVLKRKSKLGRENSISYLRL